ncbi:MAG: GLUG motif-containing protein [Planctomycetota bacterium]
MTRKTIYLSTLLVLANCCFIVSPCQARYSDGTGEPNDAYQIADANDMNEIGLHSEDWGSHFVLVNDINMADYTGTQFNIIGPNGKAPFTGVFDGNDYSISNFTYESNDTDAMGLFGYVYEPNARITDLTLINPNVDCGTGDKVGSLVGFLRYGAIRGCGVKGGSVSGDNSVGGLVGYTHGGRISNCYVTGSVSGNERVGGLVGRTARGARISNCYATGSVAGILKTGGLVGSNYQCKISNCYATGAVDGDDSTGGLVGYNALWSIENCYATGAVDGNDLTGGLVGDNCYGRISNSYATGNVDGNNWVGGLVGGHWHNSTISNCYAIGGVNGNILTGGLVGQKWDGGTVMDSFWDVNTTGQAESDGGESKTTAEMRKESTFINAGWDFVEIWNIGENQTYPYLRVYPAGDSNHDGIVDWRDFAIFANHWLDGVE